MGFFLVGRMADDWLRGAQEWVTSSLTSIIGSGSETESAKVEGEHSGAHFVDQPPTGEPSTGGMQPAEWDHDSFGRKSMREEDQKSMFSERPASGGMFGMAGDTDKPSNVGRQEMLGKADIGRKEMLGKADDKSNPSNVGRKEIAAPEGTASGWRGHLEIQERIEILTAANTALIRHMHDGVWQVGGTFELELCKVTRWKFSYVFQHKLPPLTTASC